MEPQIRILVVEDTLSLLRLYSHILTQAGHGVIEAKTGRAAMELLFERRPEIVLLDRVLPDMDGSEICSRIKEDAALSSTYVIMLSALKTTEDDRVSGLEAGADDYIVKPVGRRELLARVQVAARLKRAQLALEASEAEFRTLAENSPDIISRFDRALHHLYSNRAMRDATGNPPPQTGTLALNSDHPIPLAGALGDAIQGVFGSGKPQRIEFTVDVGAEQRTFDTRLVPEFNAGGALTSILAVSRDLSDRVRAEQEIARLATVIEQSVEAVMITDRAGRIVYTNDAAASMTGWSSAEMTGEYFQALETIFPGDFRTRFAQSCQSGDRWQTLSTCKCKYSGPCEIEANVFPVTDRHDRIINVAVVLRDVTDRRRSERERESLLKVSAALRRAGTRDEMIPVILDEILNIMDVYDAMFDSIDSDGNVVIELVRGGNVHLTGVRIPADKAMTPIITNSGRPYLNNAVHENNEIYMAASLAPARAVAGVPLNAQNRQVGVLWITSLTPISERSVRLLSLIGDMAANALHRAELYEEIQRYAAELELRVAKRTQELADANLRLRELDELKSKFVSNVSHELRTPISNLKLYMSLLQRGKPDKRGHYESMLQLSVERLGQLVEDILNLSRIEIAQQQPRLLEPTDLNALVNQVVTLHTPKAEAAGIGLTFRSMLNLPLVFGDYNQLAQLVTNLVVNALNYTPRGSVQVTTAYSADRNAVILAVRDTGVGILPDDQPHLFERFYRGNHRQPDDIPGTGLGLAIVKEIVEIHHGAIRVDSAVDNGSTFEVTLPAALRDPGLSLSQFLSDEINL